MARLVILLDPEERAQLNQEAIDCESSVAGMVRRRLGFPKARPSRLESGSAGIRDSQPQGERVAGEPAAADPDPKFESDSYRESTNEMRAERQDRNHEREDQAREERGL